MYADVYEIGNCDKTACMTAYTTQSELKSSFYGNCKHIAMGAFLINICGGAGSYPQLAGASL